MGRVVHHAGDYHSRTASTVVHYMWWRQLSIPNPPGAGPLEIRAQGVATMTESHPPCAIPDCYIDGPHSHGSASVEGVVNQIIDHTLGTESLVSGRKSQPPACAWCGKPAKGYAAIGTKRYCHEGPDATCYMLASWEDARAISPWLCTAGTWLDRVPPRMFRAAILVHRLQKWLAAR